MFSACLTSKKNDQVFGPFMPCLYHEDQLVLHLLGILYSISKKKKSESNKRIANKYSNAHNFQLRKRNCLTIVRAKYNCNWKGTIWKKQQQKNKETYGKWHSCFCLHRT